MTPERVLDEKGVLRHEAVVSRQTVDRLRATFGDSKPGAPGSRKFAIGVLVLKALAIHRSNRAHSPSPRRVLHVDYAGVDLPAPLE